MDHAPADQLILNQQEDVLRNDCFVIAFHVVLRDVAVVLDAFLRQEIRGVGLLQERVTDVFLIPENLVNGAGVPLGLACAGENAVRFKPCGNLVHAQALQVFPVDAPDDFGLLRFNDQIAESLPQKENSKIKTQAKRYEHVNREAGEKIHMLSGIVKCPIFSDDLAIDIQGESILYKDVI